MFAFPLILLSAQPVLANSYDQLRSCELSGSGGRLSVSARCGELVVAENPADPDGRQVELPFAVMPATGRPAQPDPVVFLAGGPGQSALETAPLIQRALRDINRNRDLIFLDQRGTGGANPLHCRPEQVDDPWLMTDPQMIIDMLDRCREDWDADLRFYTTTDGARDLEALREHLNIKQYNLVGGSYGTRMAQVYLRMFPDRVRAVILDGVAPTRLALGSEHGLALDRSLQALFARCVDTTECAEVFPDVDQAFETLKTRYGDWTDGPVVELLSPRSGEVVEIPFSRSILAGALRFLAYGPETQRLLPKLVYAAASSGDPGRIASQAMILTESLEDSISIGVNYAVGCTEDWPVWPQDIDQSHTLLADSIDEVYDTVCAGWPAGERPADFHEPFDSEVPILILSGELDPVTPPQYGDEAAGQFSNSRHLVAPGRGHIVLTLPCIGRIAAHFMDQPDLAALDSSCLNTLGPEPFFINLTGPTP